MFFSFDEYIGGLSQYFNDYIVLASSLLFIITIFLILKFKKQLFEPFLNINKKTWIILGIIIIIAFGLRTTIPPKQNIMFIDEPLYLDAAKNILETGNQGTYQKSIGWPIFLSVLFAIFGISVKTAIWSNIIIGSLTSGALFLFVYSLSKNNNIALFSAIIISFAPDHIRWSSSAETNIFGLFIMILALTIAIIQQHKKDINLLPITISVICLASIIRFEYYLMLLIPVIIYLQSETFKNLKSKYKSLLLSLIVGFLSVPNFIMFWYFQKQYLLVNSPQKESISHYFIQGIMELITKIFVSENIPFFLFLASIGGLLIIYKQNKINLLIPAIYFVSLIFVYGYSNYFKLGGGSYFPLKSRFIFMFYPITIIFMSITLNKLSNFIKQKTTKKYKNLILPIILLSLIILLTPNSLEARNMLSGPNGYLKTYVPELAKKEIPAECIVVAPEPITLTMFNRPVLGIPEFKEQYQNKSTGNDCVLFYNGYFCTSDIVKHTQYRSQCDIFKKEHNLEIFKVYYKDDEKFTFYKIIE